MRCACGCGQELSPSWNAKHTKRFVNGGHARRVQPAPARKPEFVLGFTHKAYLAAFDRFLSADAAGNREERELADNRMGAALYAMAPSGRSYKPRPDLPALLMEELASLA